MSVLEDRLAEYSMSAASSGSSSSSTATCSRTFVAFLETAGAERITNDLSVTWARRPGASARYHMERLSMVRGFARYLATIDPASESPPVDLLHARENRMTPYLYSEREIGALIAAAAALTPAQRGATYRTVIGVMATSGYGSEKRSRSTALTSAGSLPITAKNTFRSYAVASHVFTAPRAPTNSK